MKDVHVPPRFVPDRDMFIGDLSCPVCSNDVIHGTKNEDGEVVHQSCLYEENEEMEHVEETCPECEGKNVYTDGERVVCAWCFEILTGRFGVLEE